MKKKKTNDGVAVTNETATPLHSGMHPYWDAHWKGIILEFLSDSHPNVEVDYDKRGDGFCALFRKDDRSGREMCRPSRSLVDPKTMVPESEIDALVDSLDRFHKEAENAANTDGARQFVREYRVPDPRQMRDAWRVGRSGRFKKLLLLWGYHPNGAANDVVLPLTPTSSSWDDAKRRVDLKDALRESRRIGKSRIDWGWVVSLVLRCLAVLLVIAIIVLGLNSCTSGCGVPPETGGGGMTGGAGSGGAQGGATGGTCDGRTADTTGGTGCGGAQDGATGGTCDGRTGDTTGGTGCGGAQGGATGETCDGETGDTTGGTGRGSAQDGATGETCDGETGDTTGVTGRGGLQGGTTGKTGGGENGDTTGGTACGDAQGDNTTIIPPAPPVHFCPIHDVKLVNGKCPKFCSKHPNIHLEQDGKCRICEGAEPPPPPDCSIVLEKRGEKGDGSFLPTFKLVSQDELPGNATIAWSIDRGPDQDLGETFTPLFPDASPHTIKAAVEWVDDGTLRKVTATLPWNPAPADERIVNRDIVQIQKRNVGHETIYIYALTSDAESGRATVRSWSVERRQDNKPSRKLKTDTEMKGQHLLVHGKDIAGEANLTIVAEVSLGNGEKTKVEKTFRFRYDIVTKSESVSDEETAKLSTAGNGVVPSVFLVSTGSGIGTAFAVAKRKLVTNAHVVDSVRPGAKVSLFQANSPTTIEGVIRVCEPNQDLALISVGAVDLAPIPLAESLSADQSVACVGFPFSTLKAEKAPEGGFVPAVSIGTINGAVDSNVLDSLDGPDQYKGFMVTSDALTNPGNSGSPVVDENGRLVGVLRSEIYSRDKGKTNGKSSGLIPLPVVRDFLNRHTK